MRKKLNIALCLFIAIIAGAVQLNAQVSIGGDPSKAPQAPKPFSILELISVPTIDVGGLRLPQLNEQDKSDINSKLLADKDGSKGLFIYNTDKGFIEYWDGSKWIDPGAGNDITLPWQISPKSPVQKNIADVADSIYHLGVVGIGAKDTDPSAILNVQSSNQGVLMPRVELDSATDAKTIPNPAVGLLVYNTGNKPTFPTEGYLFWDGAQWKIFANATSAPGAATLHCESAAMNPSQQVLNGVRLSTGTLLQIPYTGSNGGNFKGVTLHSINGGGNITATIESGALAIGNGVLSFLLDGTPTADQEAPAGIQFSLADFTAANPGIISSCGASFPIGNVMSASITSSAIMGNLTLGTDENGLSVYSLVGTSPDGKFSIRLWVPGNYGNVAMGNANISISVKNNLTTPVTVIWNYSTQYSGGIAGGAGLLTMQPQLWGGAGATGNVWSTCNSSTSTAPGYWGDRGVYDGDGTEYRRYTWIPRGPDSKIVYEATLMIAMDTDTPGTAVSPTLLKGFIKFEVITAN